MREFKTAMIVCACIVVLTVAGLAIFSVWEYLPYVGITLLVLIVLGAALALVYVGIYLHHKFTAYNHIPIAQYGSVLHRRNEIVQIAPYHPTPSLPARRITREEDDAIEGQLAEEAEDMPALLPPIPTFAEMLETGVVQRAISQGQMILGYYAVDHTPRLGSWLDLYSAGIGGVTGSGKSTTTRFLLFQAALASARFIFIDPHIGDEEESLAAQFRALPGIHQIAPCDGQPAAVLKRVRWLARELDRRKRAGIKGPPLVFVIDEFNEQMRVKEVRDELSVLLLDIEQGGRKFGLFALLLGQRWSAKDLGGADIRTSLASKMGHRFSDEDQAVRFMGSKHGKKLLELETGSWLFYDTKGKTSEMITPETYAEDGATVARLMVGATSAGTSEPRFTTSEIASTPALYLLPGGETDATTNEPAERADAQTDALTPQALRVLTLLKERKGQNEIIEEVWGYKSSDGRPYRAAVEEYRVILAAIASQIGA